MNLVVGHTRSDFDAVGATVAAARLYAPAVPLLHKDADGPVKAFLATHKDALGLKTLEQIALEDVRRVVVVDTQTPDRLGPGLEPLRARPEVEWIVFDHHPTRPGDLPPGPGGRVEAVGSVSGLLACALEARGLALTPEEATAVALGIHADTGSLLYPSATATDARGLAYAMACGADPRVVSEHLEAPLEAPQRRALAALVAELAPQEARGVRFAAGAIAWPEYLEGFAAVVERVQAHLELDAILAGVAMPKGRSAIVGRAKRPDVDLLRALAPWGGRGHPQAAAAQARGVPVEALGPALEGALEGALPPEVLAADLMSAPVRTIPPETTALEAQAGLFRYGHTAFVVLEGLAPVGIVSRRDLDRAIHHGLGHAPVKGFMSRVLVTAGPTASLDDLERLMIRKDVGRVPVITESGALVGIVTRSDVLRVRYAGGGPAEAAVRAETEPLAEKLRRTWPEAWVRCLEDVAAVAGERPVYLVGGAVRDLLLDRANLDIDLVTEGPALPLARDLAAHWPGTALFAHPAFGTARLERPDGLKLDLATARTEFYPHPGALPEVEFAGLKQDLVRRDFAVNALALALAPAFGSLVDFFEAHADLEARRLRVLHPLSFVEDPTRLLRGVRFERQLGFALAPETERLARAAMATGRFDGLGGERNKVEWHRLFDGPRPDRALARLEGLDALRMLAPGLTAAPGLRARFRWLARALPPGADRHQVAWAWLLAAGQAPESLLGKLNLPGGARKAISAVAPLARRALADGTLSGHEAVEGLVGLGAWARVAALGLQPDRASRQALARRLAAYRPLALPVTGETLKRLGLAPGPAYARILERLKTELLEGALSPDAAEARAAALIREEAPPCSGS